MDAELYEALSEIELYHDQAAQALVTGDIQGVLRNLLIISTIARGNAKNLHAQTRAGKPLVYAGGGGEGNTGQSSLDL